MVMNTLKRSLFLVVGLALLCQKANHLPLSETRNTKATRGYAHGVLKRPRDAVDSWEEGKRLILEGWEQEICRVG